MSYPGLPESQPGKDLVIGASLAALSSIPVVGGPASSIIASAVAAKQRARDEEFWAWTSARVRLLETRIGDFRFDATDDEFFAAAHKALRAAQETSNQQKRQLLAEAIVNSGSWSSIPLDRRERYLDLTTRLTPEHIKLLHYLHDPKAWLDLHHPGAAQTILNAPMMSAGQVIQEHVVRGDADVIRAAFAAIEDLVDERLTSLGLNSIGTGAGALNSRTTADGKGLLEFLGDLPVQL
ncbi:hypothetical protein [Agreia sp. COWG]|uniref:hypothetical protein n=1 Tax=Agreia sp. COWG TaxID=2773266 RepID=UPI0019283684|nr:hypothetical protein [Agreia sp. COWG]CAD6015867.1 protein of unknown function [Agreia sp. COWG]